MAAILLSACGPDASAGDDETGTSDGSSSVTSGGTSGSGGGSVTTSPAGTDESTTAPPTDLPGDLPCDAFAQDCPAGLKCMPVAIDSSEWNATRCRPVAPDPNGLNESCSLLGAVGEGLDDCGLGQFCWDVDPETLDAGTCRGLCAGNPAEPTCADPNAVCRISAASALNLCLPTCDPLGDDCEDDETCVFASDTFLCAPQAGNLALGEACEALNVCAPGLLCANADAVPGCTGAQGCCAEFCDLSRGACTAAGTMCVPFFDEAPEGFEDVGACLDPP